MFLNNNNTQLELSKFIAIVITFNILQYNFYITIASFLKTKNKVFSNLKKLKTLTNTLLKK